MIKKRIVWLILILFALVADRVVKEIICSLAAEVSQPVGHRFFELPGFFVVTYHTNTGAALGMFPGGRWVFVILTVILIAAAFYFAFSGRILHKTGETAFVLLTGGALGNFVDRLFVGHVVDMFQFAFADLFFVNFIFNVADVFVSAGAVLLCVYIIFFHEKMKNIGAAEGVNDEKLDP